MISTRNLLLLLSTLALCGIAAELALRQWAPPDGYYVIVPGTRWTVNPDSQVIKGITGRSVYRANQYGIRGRAFRPNAAEYRILAVGGSTTESAPHDDREAWPHLLEEQLPGTVDGRETVVGNVGRSGLTTREHILQVRHLLGQLPRIDMVLALVGINDMGSALQQGLEFRERAPVSDTSYGGLDLQHAFRLLPRKYTSKPGWYRSTALWRLAQRIKAARSAGTLYQDGAIGLIDGRLHRDRARILLDQLPPLEKQLAEYRRNLEAMIDEIEAAHARPVFVTAPSIWQAEMGEGERRSLWLGWVGRNYREATAYYTTGALAQGIQAYNATLLDVCQKRNIDCIDAATNVERTGTMFFDDVHFTERGCRRMAEVLSRYLGERPPFR